jgi:hypothetical protein
VGRSFRLGHDDTRHGEFLVHVDATAPRIDDVPGPSHEPSERGCCPAVSLLCVLAATVGGTRTDPDHTSVGLRAPNPYRSACPPAHPAVCQPTSTISSLAVAAGHGHFRRILERASSRPTHASTPTRMRQCASLISRVDRHEGSCLEQRTAALKAQRVRPAQPSPSKCTQAASAHGRDHGLSVVTGGTGHSARPATQPGQQTAGHHRGSRV